MKFLSLVSESEKKQEAVFNCRGEIAIESPVRSLDDCAEHAYNGEATSSAIHRNFLVMSIATDRPAQFD